MKQSFLVGCFLIGLSGCSEEGDSSESDALDAGSNGAGGTADDDEPAAEPEDTGASAGAGGTGGGEEPEPASGGSGGTNAGGSGGEPAPPAGSAGEGNAGSGGSPAGEAGAGGADAGAPGGAPNADAGAGGNAGASAGAPGAAGEGGSGGTPVPEGTPIAVAVGYGMRRVASFDGLTWEAFAESTPDGGDDNDLFRGLAFGGDRFVAVGGSSMSISLVSLDGQTWQNEDRSGGDWMGGVAYLNGDFIVAGGNGLRMRSTDLGESWVDPVGYQAVHYRDAVAGDGAVVAVGHTYNESPDVGIIAVTGDGMEWTEVERAGDGFSRVAFGNGAFVATGNNGRVSRSADGSMWTTDAVGSGDGRVVFANGEFVISNSGGVFRSASGEDWTPVDGATNPIDGYINGLYLSLGWPAVIRASADMVDWTPAFDPGGSGFTRIVTGSLPDP